MVRVSLIEQSEHSECGLACVAMIISIKCKNFPINYLRNKFGVPKGGNNLAELQQILDSYKINSKGVKVRSGFELRKMGACICFWDNKHFVVLTEIKKGIFFVNDPAIGKVKYDEENFNKHFSGCALIIDYASFSSATLPPKVDKPALLRMFLQTQKAKLLILVTLSFLIQLSMILFPILISTVIDNKNDIIGNYATTVPILTVLCLLLFFGYYLLAWVKSRLITVIQISLSKNLMTHFMAKICKLPMKFFVNRSTGDLVFKANLVNYIQMILSQEVVSTTVNVVFSLIYLLILMYISPALTAVTVLSLVLIVGISMYSTQRIKEFTRVETIAQTRVQQNLVECFEGMETIKSLGIENHIITKWKNNFQEQLKIQQKKGNYIAQINSLTGSIRFVLPFWLLILGILMISKNQISIGTLISYNTLVTAFMDPIISIVGSYNQFVLLKVYISKFSEVLFQPVSEFSRVLKIHNQKINIEMKNVTFAYSKFESPIVKSLNLQVFEGEKIAIVGESGAGKSTLLRLITGQYEPIEGEVTVGGENIKSLSNQQISSILTYVNQTPVIFNDTVCNNIKLFSNCKNPEFVKAAKMSQVDKVVDNLPLGYDTQLSENGKNLSGGQKQKISLARAFLRDTKMVVMDEPTSSLDNISERAIMNQILCSDKTCIVVAHRLDTVLKFDRILVLNHGKICEVGTHEQLMQKKGMYYKLYQHSGEKEYE